MMNWPSQKRDSFPRHFPAAAKAAASELLARTKRGMWQGEF